jgi:hypothetical protein
MPPIAGRMGSKRKRHYGCVQLCAGLLAVSLLVSCAKTGEPQPPVVRVPRPPVNLAALQRSNSAVLSVPLPVENTDGSQVREAGAVEVLRIVEADRQNAAPLDEELFMQRAEIVGEVPGDRLENYLHDGIFVYDDGLSFAGRKSIYEVGFRYAVRFFNRKHRSSGLSNQVFLAPVPLPDPPSGISSETEQDCIRVRWIAPEENFDGSRPARIQGYDIYRSQDSAVFPRAPLNDQPLQQPEFADRQFEFDKTYYYRVVLIGSLHNPRAETLPSPPLRVVARDTFPPGAPRNFNVIVDRGTAVLLWVAPEATDVAGYRIYRQDDASAEKLSIHAGLITALSYRDGTVRVGKEYRYSVTAVDTHGNEGPPAQSTVEVQ